uniref:Uncharacterized protein n=1 Tax=Romanomermis culicivorax TaxID=13658 RepID=A0A915JSM8_ROMCU
MKNVYCTKNLFFHDDDGAKNYNPVLNKIDACRHLSTTPEVLTIQPDLLSYYFFHNNKTFSAINIHFLLDFFTCPNV